MRKILIAGLLITGCLFAPRMAKAGDFSASISTFPITEASSMAAQISGTKKIDRLVLSNGTSTLQVVTVYSACASTTTITAVLTVTLPASLNPVVLDYLYGNPLLITDACFRRSDSANVAHVSAHYR